jgi:chloramphenicol O-acetyltransferase
MEYMASNGGFHTVDCRREVSRRQKCCRLSSLVAQTQGDWRETAEPRSYMWAFTRATVSMANRSDVFDTEQFIHLIRVRPVLWDISCEEYSNNTKKQGSWLEVCTEMYEGFDTFEVYKRNEISKYNRNPNWFTTVIHWHCILTRRN